MWVIRRKIDGVSVPPTEKKTATIREATHPASESLSADTETEELQFQQFTDNHGGVV